MYTEKPWTAPMLAQRSLFQGFRSDTTPSARKKQDRRPGLSHNLHEKRNSGAQLQLAQTATLIEKLKRLGPLIVAPVHTKAPVGSGPDLNARAVIEAELGGLVAVRCRSAGREDATEVYPAGGKGTNARPFGSGIQQHVAESVMN